MDSKMFVEEALAKVDFDTLMKLDPSDRDAFATNFPEEFLALCNNAKNQK